MVNIWFKMYDIYISHLIFFSSALFSKSGEYRLEALLALADTNLSGWYHGWEESNSLIFLIFFVAEVCGFFSLTLNQCLIKMQSKVPLILYIWIDLATSIQKHISILFNFLSTYFELTWIHKYTLLSFHLRLPPYTLSIFYCSAHRYTYLT